MVALQEAVLEEVEKKHNQEKDLLMEVMVEASQDVALQKRIGSMSNQVYCRQNRRAIKILLLLSKLLLFCIQTISITVYHIEII